MMAKKKTVRRTNVRIPRRANLVIRAFSLSHQKGYDKEHLAFLQAYLHDLYQVDIELKKLEGLIGKELVNVEKERRLEDIDRELFAPDLDPGSPKLGSSFCPECGMFKRFRKECPYCGHHEMTV